MNDFILYGTYPSIWYRDEFCFVIVDEVCKIQILLNQFMVLEILFNFRGLLDD